MDLLRARPAPRLRAIRRRLLAASAAGMLALGTAACGGGDSTGLGLNLVPQGQVQEMGLQAWQQIRSETPVSSNAALQRRAEQVSDRILRASDKNPDEWEVVVFQGPEANAFALPGKKIGVFEGMFDVAENDAQLAAVLAHEVAHVDEAHSQERLNTEVGTQLGVQIASAALGAANVAPPQTIAALLGAGAQYGVSLPYSRNQELEADRIGLTYMAKAGYDPASAIQLWRNMSQAGGERPPTFLSTHPGPDQRIEQLQSLLPAAQQVYRGSR